jgi:hypothetical protein
VRLKIFFIIIAAVFSTHAFALNIVTAIPREYVRDVTPQGYIICYKAKTGSYKGIWSGAHSVCRYNIPGSEMWVSGYWQCVRYKVREGICLGWKWNPAHWESLQQAQLEPDAVSKSGWHTRW